MRHTAMVAIVCACVAGRGSELDFRRAPAEWEVIAPGQAVDWDEIYMLDGPRGDANQDGSVNLSDAIAISNWLFDPTVPDFGCENMADANGDGSLDSSDSIWIITWYSNGGPPPPAPGPYETGCTDEQRSSALGCDEHSCF